MLTVLFATHNGARLLPAVLESYCGLRAPAGGWKLLVVDNASTDGSREIVRSFTGRLPLTYLYEPAPGKNAALNSGLSAVEGDLVVLTDDDVFPHADWLQRLRTAADAQPAAGIFGGVVLPRWEIPPPAWILAWVPRGPVYTLTDPSTSDGPAMPHGIFGPNMAIRTAVFRDGIRFDAAIGPRGTNYAMGSETELVRRLMRQGEYAWHVHDAVVEHYIRAHQLRRAWILQRAIRFGRGQFRLSRAVDDGEVVRWWGVPRHLFRELIGQALLMARDALLFDAEGLFRAHWRFNFLLGSAIEARAWYQSRES